MTEQKNKPYRVVVAIDFTETSLPAFGQALRLVRAHRGAELHLVHVISKAPPSGNEIALNDERLDDAYRRLRTFVFDHGSATHRDADQEVWYHARIGDCAEAIHQVAVDVDADVIVVGTADKHGVERILLGSVAEQIVRMARVPVMVARRKDFQGLARTPVPEPARPGAPLHEKRADMIRSSELVAFESKLDGWHAYGLV
jgi:nucleotide-binding universal stress UspA family protein